MISASLNKIIPTEAEESYSLIEWSKFHPICRDYLIAIPNGGSRNKIEAANLKRAGVKAGVSDYFLAYPKNSYHGLWIELKRNSETVSKVSKEQTDWLDKMSKLGYAANIAYGWEHARLIIEQYLRY